MEMILGVIEDLLDRFEQGSGEDKDDAGEELKMNLSQFKTNLAPLADSGNADAAGLLQRLNALNL